MLRIGEYAILVFICFDNNDLERGKKLLIRIFIFVCIQHIS